MKHHSGYWNLGKQALAASLEFGCRGVQSIPHMFVRRPSAQLLPQRDQYLNLALCSR
jgi:hypothetical protein